MPDTEPLTSWVSEQLTELADPEKAGPMAAYMKTVMPFYGVQAAARRSVASQAARRFPPANRDAYEAGVLALWALPHREEKYVAIAWAREHPTFVEYDSLPLYELLIREGAWWDLVDEVAIHLLGTIVRVAPDRALPIMDAWINDESRWIRRAAIICQNRAGERTDVERLFSYSLQRAHEKEFFIQKAIGWALREYSYTAPEAARDFLVTYREQLSSLSYREGSKRLRATGVMS